MKLWPIVIVIVIILVVAKYAPSYPIICYLGLGCRTAGTKIVAEVRVGVRVLGGLGCKGSLDISSVSLNSLNPNP